MTVDNAGSFRAPADWTVPWRTIAIATLERSGSNLLAEYLVQTDRLGHPWEFFSSLVRAAMFPGRGETIADQCRLVLEHGRSSNGVAGIKLFPEHFRGLQDHIGFEEWFGRPRWIWLRRKDLLGQAISVVIAQQTRAFVAREPQGDLIYSSLRIGRVLERLAQRDATWRAYFARTGIEPFCVEYEELEQSPDQVVRAIASHAGVPDVPDRILRTPSLTKQRTKLNDEWRERFKLDMGNCDRFDLDETRPPRGEEEWDAPRDTGSRSFIERIAKRFHLA